MKYTFSYVCLVLMVIMLPLGAIAQQQQCALWNQDTNQIELPAGNPIGVANVNNTNRAEDLQGRPLSQSGVNCIIGSKDGKQYDPDDLSGQGKDPINLPNFDPCIIPGNPFCGNNNNGNNGGGSGGGGGGSGGGGGGGSGGIGGGTSAAQVAQALSVPQNPVSQSGSGGSLPVTAGAAELWGDEIASGANGERERKLAKYNDTSARLVHKFGAIIMDPRMASNNLPDMSLSDGGGGSTARTKISSTGNRRELSKWLGYTNWKELPKSDKIGVDDEILKTSMAIYQPTERLDLDFLNGKRARDRYLDQAKTLRGVTTLAMGFLDKTLGAGLHDIQQQADASTANHLLKQVGWSLERLASPERAQAFKDTDEKLEACLEYSLARGAPQQQINQTTRKRVEFTCSQSCGQAPSSQNQYRPKSQQTDVSRQGNGTYEYCECCASTADDLNKLAEDERTPVALNNANGRMWSLVERAFYGVSTNSVASNGSMGQVMKDFVETYKLLFGDVVMKKEAAQGGNTEPHLMLVTQASKISIATFTALHKNRCYTDDSPSPMKTLSEKADCNIQDEQKFKIKYGVCPALMSILDRFDQISQGNAGDDLSQEMAEASMGAPITADLLRSFIAKHSIAENKIAKGQERLEAATAIESFCDASAVAGVTRQLALIKKLTSDMMVLNNQISLRDKVMVNQLLEKYFDALRLAQVDEQSKYLANSVATGLSLSKDRAIQASQASAEAAYAADANNSDMKGAFSSLLAGNLITGSGGGGQTSRVKSDVADVFGSSGREIISKAISDIPKNDPIDNGITAPLRGLVGNN